MSASVSVEKFKEVLPLICDAETSADPKGWTPENPLWAHCANVTVVAEKIFGGDIMRTPSLKRIPGWEHINSSHYWNRLPDGRTEDFTAPQFGSVYPNITKIEVSSRNYILFDPKTGKPREIMKRYKLLTWRLAKALDPQNPLFADRVYRLCFENALDSPCQKFWVGCVITNKSGVIYRGCNKTIEPLKSFCDPKCVRLSIQSRTESMIGACGHAEELGVAKIMRCGFNPAECELYCAGVNTNGLPYHKNVPEFTCLRCAVQIYNADIKTIYVPFDGDWVGLSAEECVKQAVAYATKEKAI